MGISAREDNFLEPSHQADGEPLSRPRRAHQSLNWPQPSLNWPQPSSRPRRDAAPVVLPDSLRKTAAAAAMLSYTERVPSPPACIRPTAMTAANARQSRSRPRSLQPSFVHSEPGGAARAGRARHARKHARRRGGRFIAGAMALGLAGRRPELVLEAAPLRAGPPIRSGNPGGSARVDPA